MSRNLLLMSLKGVKGSLIVVRVLLTIGVLTGLWRSAGTFAILVSLGLRSITPSMFVLSAFVLTCILSYALGTSFGTAGTLGVALMTLARSGGVDPVITAGAVMSGIYFGDRASPSSSCLHLVTALTATDVYSNVKTMMKSAIIPLVISTAFYLFLSFQNPLTTLNSQTLNELSRAFNLNNLALTPAIIMLVLPVFKVKIFIAFIISIIAAFVCTVTLQNYSIVETLKVAIFGLHVDSVFDGGGLLSMVKMSIILIITGTFSGIFEGTGMLDKFQEKLSTLIKRFGEYPVILVVGTMLNAIFCNQTVGVLMTVSLFKEPYEVNKIPNEKLALDLSNSTVITAALVPYCIACSVPLSMLNENFNAILYACYLYMIPIFCATSSIISSKTAKSKVKGI